MDEQNIDHQTPEEPAKKPNMDAFYLIRILIGGYLIYLAWGLASGIFQGTTTGKALILCAIMAAVFALAGAGLIGWSLWLLMRKK